MSRQWSQASDHTRTGRDRNRDEFSSTKRQRLSAGTEVTAGATGSDSLLAAAARAAELLIFSNERTTARSVTSVDEQPEPRRHSKSSWTAWDDGRPAHTTSNRGYGDHDWERSAPPPLQPVDWGAQQRKPVKRCFVDYAVVDIEVARRQRLALGIQVEQDPAGSDATPAPVGSFSELAVLPRWLLDALADNKWSTPMPIQAQALPIGLAGKDLIGIAQTGSGKTAAFLLPAVVHIDHQPALTRAAPGPVALVLAPTRELAVQISDEAAKVLKHSWQSPRHVHGLRTVCLYGGGSRRDQLRSLSYEGAHIVVATPGRLLDFLTDRKLSLLRVTYLVLDEADRMLDMGFAEDVRKISAQIRPERQVALYSATWSNDVQTLAREFCSEDPVRIRVGGRMRGSGDNSSDTERGDAEDLMARAGITQQVVTVDFDGDWKRAEEEKRRVMDQHIRTALQANPANKVLVFVSQKTLADDLKQKLCDDGFAADCIHGGRSQDMRLWVLDEFRKGSTRLLVTTDVLGRGVDIPNVSHVVVFDMGSVEEYVHRIGRTGRGPDGTGHALVFFEYYHKMPQNAANLIGVLERSRQHVPDELRRIAAEVASGKRWTPDQSTSWRSQWSRSW